MRSVTSLKNDFFEPFNGDEVIATNFRKWKTSPTSKYYAFISSYKDKDDDACMRAILDIWKFKSDRSIDRGKALHKLIENYLIDKQDENSTIFEKYCAVNEKYCAENIVPSIFENLVDEEDCAVIADTLSKKSVDSSPTYIHIRSEYDNFVEWMSRKNNIKVYAVEWKIRSAKLNLVGVVDAAFEYIDAPGELLIVDWKRNATIELENPVGKMGLRKPFDVLPDCNFGHYSMQLNVYARMIELEHAPLKVRDMNIVQITKLGVEEFRVNRLF